MMSTFHYCLNSYTRKQTIAVLIFSYNDSYYTLLHISYQKEHYTAILFHQRWICFRYTFGHQWLHIFFIQFLDNLINISIKLVSNRLIVYTVPILKQSIHSFESVNLWIRNLQAIRFAFYFKTEPFTELFVASTSLNHRKSTFSNSSKKDDFTVFLFIDCWPILFKYCSITFSCFRICYCIVTVFVLYCICYCICIY